MGHYVTAYCSAHGEVDMDDSLAFCPDCYEVTPKGALAEARAEIERLHSRWSTGLVQEQAARIAELEAKCSPLYASHELRAERLERAELEADVVWCTKHRFYGYEWHSGKVELREVQPISMPGTDEAIKLAVREARNGVS